MKLLDRRAIKNQAREHLRKTPVTLHEFMKAGLLLIILSVALALFNSFVKYLISVIDLNPEFGGRFALFFARRWTKRMWQDALSNIVTILSVFLLPVYIAYNGYVLSSLRSIVQPEQLVLTEARINYKRYFFVSLACVIIVTIGYMFLFIPGIILACALSMVQFISHDNPALSAMEAIELSYKITRGYKMDIFVLYLSFFPWMLLNAITYNVAFIYTLPYFQTVKAMYYENLKFNALQKSIAIPEDFGMVYVNDNSFGEDF